MTTDTTSAPAGDIAARIAAAKARIDTAPRFDVPDGDGAFWRATWGAARDGVRGASSGFGRAARRKSPVRAAASAPLSGSGDAPGREPHADQEIARDLEPDIGIGGQIALAAIWTLTALLALGVILALRSAILQSESGGLDAVASALAQPGVGLLLLTLLGALVALFAIDRLDAQDEAQARRAETAERADRSARLLRAAELLGATVAETRLVAPTVAETTTQRNGKEKQVTNVERRTPIAATVARPNLETRLSTLAALGALAEEARAAGDAETVAAIAEIAEAYVTSRQDQNARLRAQSIGDVLVEAKGASAPFEPSAALASSAEITPPSPDIAAASELRATAA